ncbi:MAG: hypothetical protein JWQ87_4101 [Candidatus Sulfotelmatobacter sp.]|nr:hypothetical protein [Candidatus Sulfotelmatobacter sp.]
MCYLAGEGQQCSLPDAKAQGESTTMTWIRTIPMSEADETLRQAVDRQKALYPKEYGDPVQPDDAGGASIVGAHTLIPEALYHSFATFGALMSPQLPLSRRQHEMITTMVSVTNRCRY